jgi:hypothetical protein
LLIVPCSRFKVLKPEDFTDLVETSNSEFPILRPGGKIQTSKMLTRAIAFTTFDKNDVTPLGLSYLINTSKAIILSSPPRRAGTSGFKSQYG